MQEVGSARKTQRGLVVFSSRSAAGPLTCPHVSPVRQSRDTLLSRSEVPRTKPRCLGFGFFQLVRTSSQLHRVNRLLTWIRPSWGQWAQRLAEKFFFYCRGLEMGAVLWMFQFSSVQSFSHVRLFVTTWTAARQASLSITNSWSLLKLMSMESVMPSNHLILCCLLLPPSNIPNIRVFPNESALHIRWPKYWMFVSLQIHTQNFNACSGIRRWGL